MPNQTVYKVFPSFYWRYRGLVVIALDMRAVVRSSVPLWPFQLHYTRYTANWLPEHLICSIILIMIPLRRNCCTKPSRYLTSGCVQLPSEKRFQVRVLHSAP